MCPLHQLLLGQSAGASGTVPGGEGAANADSVDDTGICSLVVPPCPVGFRKITSGRPCWHPVRADFGRQDGPIAMRGRLDGIPSRTAVRARKPARAAAAAAAL
jgi:hypothetical protein